MAQPRIAPEELAPACGPIQKPTRKYSPNIRKKLGDFVGFSNVGNRLTPCAIMAAVSFKGHLHVI
jgi:hypothetical protein